MDKFNFERNLAELFQLLLNSNNLSYKQLSRFIEEVKFREKFKVAAAKISPEISIALFKFYTGKGQQLLEILQLFSFNKSKIIENEEKLFCGLLETEPFIYNQSSLMKKLSKMSRTQCLAACLKNGMREQAFVVLDSGEIDPAKVDLSEMSDELLLCKRLIKRLLQSQVNPSGLKSKASSNSPLKRLAIKCPLKFSHQKSEIVQTMKLLIDAGAEVEDLSNYRGNFTPPLHVATELAIATGELRSYLEQLCTVH